jgi:excisionase family DNA binding protein
MKRRAPETAQLLTVRDLADYLKLHPGTIYRMLKAGQLPGFRVGSDWRFNRDDIDRWLTEREKKVKT